MTSTKRGRPGAARLGKRGSISRLDEFGKDKFEIVAPPHLDPRRADGGVSTRLSTRKGRARLRKPISGIHLLPRRSGDRRARIHYRRAIRRSPRSYDEHLHQGQLFTIDDVFGGWRTRRPSISTTRRVRHDLQPVTPRPRAGPNDGAIRRSVIPGSSGSRSERSMVWFSLIVLVPLARAVPQIADLSFSAVRWSRGQPPQCSHAFGCRSAVSFAAALVNLCSGR